jgi:hypothetical protein
LRLGLILSVELLVLVIAFAPYERFSRFAYGDSGADLVIQYLLTHGLSPTVDFGYIYGLFPLCLGRVWYALLGASPAAFQSLTVGAALVMVWGLARFVRALEIGVAGVALIVLAIPDSMLALHIAAVQALEPMFLVHALAEQASGKRSRALALVTACVFVKPSMAYVYGLLLVVAIAVELKWKARWRDWARAIGPAAILGLALVALLATMFGVVPLFNSLVPGAGAKVYREGGYGFFRGLGRAFWWRPAAGLWGYVRYEIGYWLAGSLVLTSGGFAAIVAMIRSKGSTDLYKRRCEVVATCASLHVVFVTTFFGNRFSWVYYVWVLVAGLAAMSTLGRACRWLVWCLALMVLISDRSRFQDLRKCWVAESRSAETLGIWATDTERDEWRKVLALTEDSRPVLLAGKEGITLLEPRFEPPAVSYLVPGHPVPSELRRKADQLADAKVVVRVLTGWEPTWGRFERWPEISAALDGLVPVWTGREFAVLRRVRPPSR